MVFSDVTTSSYGHTGSAQGSDGQCSLRFCVLGDTNEGQPGSAALLGLYVSQGWAPGILRREGKAARAKLSPHRMLGNDVLAAIGGNMNVLGTALVAAAAGSRP